MWPFHRKQKISSNELANLLAISAVSTDLDKSFLFKEITQLNKKDFLFEENMLSIVILHCVVINYFNYNEDKYIKLLTNHINCCIDRMMATHIIDSSRDFRAIFNKRFNEYRKAFVAYINDNDKKAHLIACKMCECFGVSDRDIANLVPAEFLFFDLLKAREEYFRRIMETFKIDESSKYKFDIERLIRDLQKSNKGLEL